MICEKCGAQEDLTIDPPIIVGACGYCHHTVCGSCIDIHMEWECVPFNVELKENCVLH